MSLSPDRSELCLDVHRRAELQRARGDGEIALRVDVERRTRRDRDTQPPDAGQAARRGEQRIEPAGCEHEALGAPTQRDVASDVERPDTRPRQGGVERHVARREIDDAREARAQIDDGRVRLGHRDPELADDHDRDRVREREHRAGRHRDDRKRTAPAKLQDRAGHVLADLRREDRRNRREHQIGPGDEIVQDQDVLGAALGGELTQGRRVDRAVEPDADGIQREAEEISSWASATDMTT